MYTIFIFNMIKKYIIYYTEYIQIYIKIKLKTNITIFSRFMR